MSKSWKQVALLSSTFLELISFLSMATACGQNWTKAGSFCYKQLNTSVINGVPSVITSCAQESAVLPTLRSNLDFQAFRDLLPKFNWTAPFRVPLGLRVSRDNELYWSDSGEKFVTNSTYWRSSMTATPGYCASISTLTKEYLIHNYDCSWPTNSLCQRGYIDSTTRYVQCNEIHRCSSNISYYTDTNQLLCESSNRRILNSTDAAFAANAFYEGVTTPFYSFRLATSEVQQTANNSDDVHILATNSSQLTYLTKIGYSLEKIVGFLPNVSSTRHVRKWYLYWRRMPPIDSALAEESERNVFDTDQEWELMDTVYVFAKRSDKKCTVSIDCQWSEWSDWSQCTQTCDGGYRTRNRSVILPPSFGGSCDGDEQEIDNHPCSEICARDCDWNWWTTWSGCSVSCANGTRTRNRSVKSYPTGRGKKCIDSDGVEIGPCSDGPCPIDCVWSDWSEWSQCSSTCGPPGIRYRNRSVAIMEQYNGHPCLPDGAFSDSVICDVQECPEQNDTYADPISPSWRVAVQTMQSLGSSAVISCSSASFVLSLGFRTFSIESVLHMGQELSMTIAHTLISVFGFRGQTIGINPALCIPVAVALHYLFIVCFLFMALEALQAYSILTNVVSNGGFFDRRTSCIISIFSPLIIVLPTSIVCYSNFVSTHSCWLNMEDPSVLFFVVGPLIMSFASIVILAEATALEDYYPPLVGSDPKKDQVASICIAGLLIKAPLAIASYILGALAVHHRQPWMYTCTMPLNICVGVAMIIFHVSSDETVLSFVRRKILNRISCCRRKEEQKQKVTMRTKLMRYKAAKRRREQKAY